MVALGCQIEIVSAWRTVIGNASIIALTMLGMSSFINALSPGLLCLAGVESLESAEFLDRLPFFSGGIASVVDSHFASRGTAHAFFQLMPPIVMSCDRVIVQVAAQFHPSINSV